MNISKILKEEFARVISVLITLLVPLILISYAYKLVYINDIPYGICNNDDSALSRNIVSQIENHPGLNVIYYTDSQEDLQKAIQEKKITAGMIIPKDFGNDVSLRKSPSVLFLIDDTNMMIGGNALSYAGTVIGTLNAGVQMKMMQGYNMYATNITSTMGTFSYVERLLYDPTGSYIRNIMYTLIPLVLQMTFITKFIIPLLNEKKKELTSVNIKSRETVYIILDIILRIIIMSIGCVAASFIVLLIGRKMFFLPLRGDIFIYAGIMCTFLFSLIGISFFISAIVDNTALFLQGYLMFNSAFVLLSGVTYPLYMMPKKLVAFVKMFLPLVHVAIPLKFLNLKGAGWDAAIPGIYGSLRFGIIWLIIGIISFTIKIIIMKKKKNIDEKEENDTKIQSEINEKEPVFTLE